MSYHTLDGTELPCVFIKDIQSLSSAAELRA